MSVTRASLAVLAFLGAAAFGFWGIPSLSASRSANYKPSSTGAPSPSATVPTSPDVVPPTSSSVMPPAKHAADSTGSSHAFSQNVPPAAPLRVPDPHTAFGPPAKLPPGTIPPEVTSQIAPIYTEAARQANASGSVRIALFVTPAGFPRDIRVIRGLPYGLNRNAIEAVSHWHFRPAMQNGQPIQAETEVEVVFR